MDKKLIYTWLIETITSLIATVAQMLQVGGRRPDFSGQGQPQLAGALTVIEQLLDGGRVGGYQRLAHLWKVSL
jgi:hypothetical protein